MYLSTFPHFGEIAALLTAVLWSVSAVFIGLAGQRFSSVVINRFRLLLALIILAGTHRVVFGTLLPFLAEMERWFWLTLSGVIGFAMGDTLLFQAYTWLGPRLAMLLKSLAPVFSALLAWLWLGETLSVGQTTGILLTVGGISWVISARKQGDAAISRKPRLVRFLPGVSEIVPKNLSISGTRLGTDSVSLTADDRRYILGILCGVGTALTQALGLILAKKGLDGNFSAFSGNLMRMLGGATALWMVTIFQGQAGATLHELRRAGKASGNIAAGTLLGSVIGVWFSLLAIQTTDVGIASTLMALVPIFMLPIGYFVFKERFGWPAIAGTVVAVVGVALLFVS